MDRKQRRGRAAASVRLSVLLVMVTGLLGIMMRTQP
jgi:hypothetical protein